MNYALFFFFLSHLSTKMQLGPYHSSLMVIASTGRKKIPKSLLQYHVGPVGVSIEIINIKIQKKNI